MPDVANDSIDKAQRVVWYRSPPLVNGGQATFKYTSDFYAFVGECSAASSNLQTNTEISVLDAKEIKIGIASNNGDRMIVKVNDEALEISPWDKTSTNGSFGIITDQKIDHPNQWVIGLARKQENNDTPNPVAAVELINSSLFTFKPNQTIYVARGLTESGRILKDIPDKVAKIEFSGASKEATIGEDNKGTFSGPTYK